MKTSRFQQFFFISSLAGILLFLSGRSAHTIAPTPETEIGLRLGVGYNF